MIGRIIPVLVLLAAIGIFFGYIHPTYTGEIAAQQAKIQSYDNALLAAATFREKETALVAQQESVSSTDRARIESFLPDGVDNVQLIVDLNALASRSGMRLSDFNIAESKQDDRDPGRLALEAETATDSLDITVSAIGTYAAFRTFLEGVEFSLRPMDLVRLTLTDSDTGVYTYNMTFRIYWLR